MANIIAAFLVQVLALRTTDGLTKFTWLGATIFHEIVYTPIIVTWIMAAAGSYDQVVWFVETFKIVHYAVVWGGVPFWALCAILFVWLLPVFGVDTGFLGNGGEGFGLVLLYVILGGADMVASILYLPVFENWKVLVLEMKLEEEERALLAEA